MAEKPKFISITDPDMADELTRDPADLSKPHAVKPNGHLWVDPGEFEAWRAGREPSPPTS